MMQFMTLKSIISNVAITLLDTDTLAQAMDVMSESKISSIVVLDDAERPIGIFTERDALHIVSKMTDTQTQLGEVMTRNPFCVEHSLHLHDAYMMMEEKAYRHLVVVDEVGKFVGVVSEGDFLRHIGFDELNRFKLVAEAMESAPLVIDKNATLMDSAALMRDAKSEYAIILEGKHPIGMITERDIVHYCANVKERHSIKADVIAHNNFKIIKKTTLLHEASALMSQHGIHQLIVVDDKQNLVGLLSRHNILHAVHGNYFDFLMKLLNRKNDTILQLEDRKNELRFEKNTIEEHKLKYQKLFETIPDGVVLIDAQTLIAVEFNRAAYEYLGYSAEEFSKLKVSDYEILESEEETFRRIDAVRKQGFDSFETKHRTKEGKIVDVWVNVAAADISGADYLIAVYRDISKQKSAEVYLKEQSLALEQQGSLLRSLFQTIPDLIWLKDIDGTYLACNVMFERLYNAKESEIVGKNDFDFVDAELAAFFREHDKAAIAAGGSRTNEEFLSFGDGSYAGYFETVKTPMKDSEGKLIGVLGIARDISERKAKDLEITKIQSLVRIGTWEWDISRDRFSGSSEAYRIFGVPSGQKVTLDDVLERFIPEDRERVKANLFNTSREINHVSSLYQVMGEDDKYRWIKTHTEFQYDQDNNPIKAVGIFQDLTERIGYEQNLQAKDADLNEAQALAHIGSWRLDVANNDLEWSDETYRIFGIKLGAPISYEMFLEKIHPDDVEKVDFAWQKALQGKTYDIEHRIIVDGEIKWVHEHAKLETDTSGNLLAGIGMVQEITQRKLYEKQLESLANYDPLTGLANRGLLVADLQRSIKQAKRDKKQVALLMFDLDRFKDINDSYGHAAGDELLQQVAKRFSSRLREGDIISRLGGDEFAIVLKNFLHPEDAGRLAEEMIETLASNYKLSGGISVHVGASAGIVLYPDHANDAQTLLQYVDAALYKIGAEALIRWNHPARGLVSPLEFIPIAEDTGLIIEIGEWILNETCRQGKIWNDAGHRLTLAVNLSANQVRYQNIPLLVEKALKKNDFQANRLELEITESALMQREEETVEMLHSLRAKGIRLAIDDFGTGYSSLSYLKRFPIDVLKIDKSFVDDIPYDSDDTAIVTAIVAMGQALGFQVLAEGVEHEEQLQFLKEKGCEMYQGYLKSKPLNAKEFEKLLSKI
jgi:diguanylate cyclase (GGDEF)-like protein/PAS domain S-box-containing protein